MRVFLANVGVNTKDAKERAMKSPRFDDGAFEFVPIKERSEWRSAAGVRRYRDLPSWTGRAASLADFIPLRMWPYAAHDDPDFGSLTYGDVHQSRGSNLEDAVAGDELWFLARLWSHGAEGFVGCGDFFLVGYLTITHNVSLGAGGLEALSADVRARVERNAHWTRFKAGASEGARVLVGDVDRSARFQRAVLVTPDVAGTFFAGEHRPADDTYWRDGVQLFNHCGTPRRYARFGSITRTVQHFLDDSLEVHRQFIERLHSLARGAGRARL